MQVFSQEWFLKHQRELLRFANTRFGRRILRIDYQGRIDAILPHAYFSIIGRDGDRLRIRADFRTHPKFAKRLYYAFRPLWRAFHAWDILLANRYFPRLNLGFDTLGPIYPAAGAVSPCDGGTNRDVVQETFATLRGGAGTFGSATETLHNAVSLRASTGTDLFNLLQRGHFLFDTSPLPDDATINSATFSLYHNGKTTGLGSTDVDLVATAPASTSDIVASDHATLGTTRYATGLPISGIAAGYNDFTLNATGLAAISKTGISKFGTRTKWDTDNSFTGTWASTALTSWTVQMADTAGTSQDPKLVVVYTVANMAGFFSFMPI